LTDQTAPRSFASDNFAPVHPKVMAAIVESNQGHAMAYGGDDYTSRARDAFRALFGPQAEAHFVFNGTAANVLSLMAFQKSYGAVLCSDVSHVANDESTAPERLLGMRLIKLKTNHGKIDPAELKAVFAHDHGVHWAKPVVLSITQPTELGTVYSLEELRTLIKMAHDAGVGVHMDGARLGCALARLGVSAREMVVESGVDILSFGGTKQGMLCGEAVVVLRRDLAEDFPYWQKNSMQLASKMRFISAQFLALLQGDLWLENARVANGMAQHLKEAVGHLPYVGIAHPVEANALFVTLPKDIIAPLTAATFFWPWDPEIGMVRWMCSFDTQHSDIDHFIATLRKLAG
jgi:threonine aldolase